MTTEDKGDAPAGSQTLERGLAVLVELSRHPDGLTVAQVAAACGLHRSITTRLLVSLERTGFAARDQAGLYRVGSLVTEISQRTRPQLREIAEPVLRRLALTVDATASLVEVRGEYAVTTLVAEPPTNGPRFSYRLGNRDPLDQGAGGLAALASGPPRPGDPDRVAATRERGHIVTHAELNPGAYGIAAPLPGWDVRAAINIVTNRKDVLEAARVPLLEAVREIGAQRRTDG
ncbi:helix-turn-helix domain-containing protein [Actinomadura graeca]|uniref:Helix-turn-helix domain-containing protein n=1 Tax=Actinomadura graeca TaxID=2750812 RepID=A0ABX8QYX9_9ACTN|nr:helix-turn-helix domain-containing protein [Actinomadura graeca]QXJ23823.1 helix-turn-helix domain-containing protein [Actinomadura graeca]